MCSRSASVDDVSVDATASPRTWRLFKERVQQAVEDIGKKHDDSDKEDASEDSVKDQDEGSESSSILDKFKNKRRAVFSKLKKDSSPCKGSPSKGTTIKEDDSVEDKLVDVESGVEMVEEMVFVQTIEKIPIIQSTPRPLTPPPPPPDERLQRLVSLLRVLVQKEAFLFAVLATVVTLVLRLSSFWQGFFVAAFIMLAYRNICDALKGVPAGPTFVSPPAENIEEHKSIKTYSGWMNQIDSYNPEFYHVADTQSVFVTIEGSVLRMSYTKVKISKRHLWNDKTRKKTSFVSEKVFDLRGATIELWPRGLARKRFYSRKYPIKITFAMNAGKGNESPKFRDSFEEESDNERTDSQISIKTLDYDMVSMLHPLKLESP